MRFRQYTTRSGVPFGFAIKSDRGCTFYNFSQNKIEASIWDGELLLYESVTFCWSRQ